MTAKLMHHFHSSVALFCLGVLTACQQLPQTAHLPKSQLITHQAQNKHRQLTSIPPSHVFKQVIDEQKKHNPHSSGYYPISTGANAFAARSVLTDMATTTIDIQYYIWHNDEAGQMMIHDLWEAAERGVVVRLLLDDFNGSVKLDELLLAFAKHPNVAVRLSNPFNHRRFRATSFLTDAARLNRRMHNKSMTFDNQLSIIGGRNIGNEYLNNAKHDNFSDMDVLLIGDVVKDVTASFESYWNDDSSYDIETLAKPTTKTLPELIGKTLSSTHEHGNHQLKTLRTYRQALESSTIIEALWQGRLPFRWAKIEFLADDVHKLTNKASPDTHLISLLQSRMGRPKKQLSIISSYFVPTKEGVRTLRRLAKSGVTVSILTNSYDATDVGAVHSGYAHWRHDLLDAGVNLYELKSAAISADGNKLWRNKHETTTSLHAKAFAVDDQKVFIGSYNIDPRSANFNTELGVVIYDDKLAYQLHQALSNQKILNQAYKVVLTQQNTLEWHTLEQGRYTIYKNEPNMKLGHRAGVAVMSLMPIDWLL
ncbi:phospholipase D family protein [Moraxella oculi]|uniref:Phospholipase D family protein n=1 Tax=Moraxella oculi TaxID=2940516 RepID=A0ABW8U9X4_9GAMM